VEIRRRVRDVLDDRMGQHEIERCRTKRQDGPVGAGERDVAHAFFGSQTDASIAEAIRRVDGDDRRRLLGKRHSHAATAAPIVQHAAE
jgi:hypothetical protein